MHQIHPKLNNRGDLNSNLGYGLYSHAFISSKHSTRVILTQVVQLVMLLKSTISRTSDNN